MDLFNRAGQQHTANTTTGVKNGPARSFIAACGRCGGSGHYSYNTIDGTRCYGCHGSGRGGVEVETLYTAEQLAKLNERADAKAAKKAAAAAEKAAKYQAECDAARAAFQVEHAAILAILTELVAAEKPREDEEGFWLTFRDGAIKNVRMSERMVEVVKEGHARLLAKRELAAKAHHVGSVGERLRGVKAEVLMSRHISTLSEYPRIERHLVKLRTEDGADLVWFTGNGVGLGAAVVDFTVKQHDVYQGAPQTIVQRVKLAA